MNCTLPFGATALCALLAMATAFAGEPEYHRPGLDGASAPTDLAATEAHSKFPGGEVVDGVAARDTKSGRVHRLDDLLLEVDENGDVSGVCVFRVLDGETVVEERDMPLTGSFQCNFKGDEDIEYAPERGAALRVRLRNSIKANATIQGGSRGGGRPFTATLNLKQDFERTTVNGVVESEDGDGSFKGKCSTKAGSFGSGRSDVEIDGWNPGTIEFAFTVGSDNPFGNGQGKWRTDGVVFVGDAVDPIDGGNLQFVGSFRDAPRDRNGKTTINGRNGSFKTNAQGIVTTTNDEADEPGFGPEHLEFFPTKTLVIGPASQSLVQTNWADAIIEGAEED